jgi:hypothetical protein
MPEDVRKSSFVFKKGCLAVSLERSAFDEVVKLIQEKSVDEEISEIQPNAVFEIVVDDASRFRPESPRSMYWKDRVGLFGCALVAAVVIFVFVMGILAICGLIALPR